ncbi:MAG: 50S ribosomal protein L29 [Ignavibacteria bacterium]|jgi:large subunit ribosomal protein L29|nr:50S ribosomal protein L29 [Ignavibacteria bacterium]MCU7499147.1 50S ribosomal protein L29 [Ignavibacteria bacterium]MCU7502501.1 50S ribosomal protein L29 [Ignavibacteria bacterium]MCU7512961.1 50S ribosomal protein L29 [Ignavibacteria bacterium]MCU7514934.1 50S ribosomal protein L29 [Ignavibacteria bacterium]
MKIHEIREMTSDDIKKKIQEDRKDLLDLNFSHALKQLTNTAKLKLIRKDIAKMQTVLRQRELNSQQVQKENK